jgi:hypothetical protein
MAIVKNHNGIFVSVKTDSDRFAAVRHHNFPRPSDTITLSQARKHSLLPTTNCEPGARRRVAASKRQDVADGLQRQQDLGRSFLGAARSPYRLNRIELDFLELMAKGFDVMDASRSLGVSFSTGAQIRKAIAEKLDARDDNQLRHLVASVARGLPQERFAVLDHC